MRKSVKTLLALALAAGLSGGAPPMVAAGPVCPMPVGASCDSHWTDPGGEGGGQRPGGRGAVALAADEIEDLPLPPPRPRPKVIDCEIPPGEGDSHWTWECV